MNFHQPDFRPRLLAIDPSLTQSGWALFCLLSGELLSVGEIRSLSTKHPLAYRLRDLQTRIGAMLAEVGLSAQDVMVCEAPTTMRDPSAAFKVEQVRSLFEALARMLGSQVPGRLNPRSVHQELLGVRGRQLPRKVIKDSAMMAVTRLYASALQEMGFASASVELQAQLRKRQDVVDAILLGTVSVARWKTAQSTGTTLSELFAEKRRRHTQVSAYALDSKV